MDNWKNTEPFVWNIALNHSGLPVMAFARSVSFLGAESPVVNCKEFNLADGEFLPIYLGYFFVSVGVSEHFTMAVVYLIVFVFTFLSQTQYYNPIYLLLATTTTMSPQKAEQRFSLSEKDRSSAILDI